MTKTEPSLLDRITELERTKRENALVIRIKNDRIAELNKEIIQVCNELAENQQHYLKTVKDLSTRNVELTKKYKLFMDMKRRHRRKRKEKPNE